MFRRLGEQTGEELQKGTSQRSTFGTSSGFFFVVLFGTVDLAYEHSFFFNVYVTYTECTDSFLVLKYNARERILSINDGSWTLSS